MFILPFDSSRKHFGPGICAVVDSLDVSGDLLPYPAIQTLQVIIPIIVKQLSIFIKLDNLLIKRISSRNSISNLNFFLQNPVLGALCNSLLLT